MSVEYALNIVDIVTLAVTLSIAYFVQRWDRRASENALLWELARDHWRTAIALFENNYGANADSQAEIASRRKMIQRTALQIRVIDGDQSGLAAAFQALAEIENWDNSPQSDVNKKAVWHLTIEMAKQFGSRRARRNAEHSLQVL